MSSKKTVFKELNTPNSIGFVFSSSMENIDHACEKTTQYLRLALKNIDSQLFAINLGIREGLSNAIRHGNANDSQKEVRFLLTIIDDVSLRVEIEDEGAGFDWRKQQTREPSGDEDHGRGIPIIDMYFTNYFYNDKGNILYLEKDISS